jgi:ElaA protein
MRFQWSRFDALSASELHDLLYLRQSVLVVEQASPYPDLDGRDPGSHHLRLWTDDSTTLGGCARCLGPELVGDGTVSFGRLALAPTLRGQGMGRLLVAEALRFLEERWPRQDVVIGAQAYLESFYGSFGFRRESDLYDDGGIPHIDMRLSR